MHLYYESYDNNKVILTVVKLDVVYSLAKYSEPLKFLEGDFEIWMDPVKHQRLTDAACI